MKVFRLLILLLVASPAFAITYFVSISGSDSNPGTQAAPFQSIQHAANLVNPGDTIIVQDGLYNCANQPAAASTPCINPPPGGDASDNALVNMIRGGTASSPVTLMSQNPLGAVLDGTSNQTPAGISVGASYIVIQGFEIRNFSGLGITNDHGGSNLTIQGNNIHDIGRYCTSTGIGRDGIFLSYGNVTVQQNQIHDIGRYAPGESGCSGSSFYQANDHGLYIHDGGSDLIADNIFYRNEHGWSIQLYPNTGNNISIYHNSFLWGDAYGYTGFIVINNSGESGLNIEDNIFYSAPQGHALYWASTSGYSGTVGYNITSSGTVSDHSSISGVNFSNNSDNTDPQLVSAGSSTMNGSVPNANLQGGSPAIAAGVTVSAVTTDFAGNAFASPPSVGAYQFATTGGNTPPPPPPTGLSATVQ